MVWFTLRVPVSSFLEIPQLAQRRQDALGAGPRRLLIGVNDQLGIERRLIRIVDAGEALNLAGQRFFIQALGIARNRHIERHVDEDLEKAATVALANVIAD